MPLSYHSSYFNLEIDTDMDCFSLTPTSATLPGLRGCRMSITLRQLAHKQQIHFNAWEVQSSDGENCYPSAHGPLTRLTVLNKPGDSRVKVEVVFALAQDHPIFMWKIKLCNESDEPVWLDQIEFLRVGGRDSFGNLDFPGDPSRASWSFFSNGWQSWSHTGTYLQNQVMRISRLGFLQQPMVVNHGTPALRMPGYYTADFFGAVTDLTTGAGLVVGFLSQKNHFGTIEALLYDQPTLALFTRDGSRLDPGTEIETDWAVITPFHLPDADPFGTYNEAVAREHDLNPSSNQPVPSGWCSWYQYFSNVTGQKIRANLHWLDENRHQLPLKLVQIDDGFESSVGDWFSFASPFKDGVAPLAREISDRGFQPGLWLAPFILDRRSRFFRDHPEFILRTRRGNPVNSGFGWNSLTAAIDLTVPGALEETCRPVRTAIRDWGFHYLKLDFLYAAALPGTRHDPTRTRAQIMRMGMQAMRDAMGSETFSLGCGLPLGSGIGLVDAMRISSDVYGNWRPNFHGIEAFLNNEPHMPSARNAIKNTLTRASLHNRWWANDPDCLLVRPESDLTEVEVQCLATVIGMSGGSLLMSDDLPHLPPERLKIAQILLPVVGKRPEILDLLTASDPQRLRLMMNGPQGSWTVLAHINWQDNPQRWTFTPTDFGLPDGSYWLSSFWDEGLFRYEGGAGLALPAIPAHGAALLACYPAQFSGEPAYLGSSLHFAQGFEVAEWERCEGEILLTLNLKRQGTGFFRLYLPRPPIQAMCGGAPLGWVADGDQVYRFPLEMAQTTNISVHF